jgi:hypothetical protein
MINCTCFIAIISREPELEKEGGRQEEYRWHQKEEVWVIPLSDTIIENRTMMIESYDTVPTLRAV